MAGFFKRRVTKARNTLSDWLGVGIAVGVFKMMKDIFIAVFMPSKREKAPTETFEAAVARMNLTEADLEERRKMFLIQTFLYLFAGLSVIIYAIWLAFHAHLIGMLVALLVALMSFSYAFRSHFWLFQIKQKKLGCTFKEYMDGAF